MGNKRKSSNSQPTTAGPTEAPSSIAKKRKSMPNVVKDLQKSLRNTDSSDSGPAAITGYNDRKLFERNIALLRLCTWKYVVMFILFSLVKSDQDTMKFLRAQPQLDANFMSTLLNFGIKEMGNREARSENRLPWEALDSNTVVKCILSSFIQINDETARWADYPLSGSKENPLNVVRPPNKLLRCIRLFNYSLLFVIGSEGNVFNAQIGAGSEWSETLGEDAQSMDFSIEGQKVVFVQRCLALFYCEDLQWESTSKYIWDFVAIILFFSISQSTKRTPVQRTWRQKTRKS